MIPLAGLWRSIWRFHRLLASILVLEYALAFAIVLTAMNVLVSRAAAINQPSGVDEQGLYILQGRGFNQPVHRFEVFNARAQFAALVGGENVAMGSSTPFFGAFSQVVQISNPDDKRRSASLQVDAYEGGQHFASVLGLRLLHGRKFQPDEIVRRYGDDTHLVILSASLAKYLFRDAEAIGKQVKIGGESHTVVGVIDSLAAPQYLGSRRTMQTILLPRLSNSHNLLFIRYSGSKTNLESVLADLRKHDMGKVRWSLASYASVRSRYFMSDRLTVAALAVVVFAVMLTALCGILGLTNYWVAKRKPQIAIRRALGAKKRDINMHFLLESGVLAIMGLLAGTVVKFFFDRFFMGSHIQGGLAMWAFSIMLVMLLVVLVVYASLRRWQRMSPIELMRQTSI